MSYGGVSSLGDLVFDGVIADECHGLPARTRCTQFAKVKSLWRIGLSGTPLDRTDGANAVTVGLVGPVRYRVSLDELERRGFLSKSKVEQIQYDWRKGEIVG
jgi:superfamily II DNA or RNA helicase